METAVLYEEFTKTILLVVTPEPDNPARLWVYTNGMIKSDLQELEIRDVDPLLLAGACKVVNGWSYVSACMAHQHPPLGQPFEYGASNSAVSILVKPVHSPDPFWEDHPLGCLRFEVVASELRCSCGDCLKH